MTDLTPSQWSPDSQMQGPLPLYSETLEVGVLWNANAGSTLAAKWLFFQEERLDEAEAYAPSVHQYRQQVYCERPGYRDQVTLIPSLGNRVIKFVRNPFDRAVSSYLSYCQQAHQLTKPRLAPVLGAIARHVGRSVGDGSLFSFREFVSWLGSLDLESAGPPDRLQLSAWERSGGLADMSIVRVEEASDALSALEDSLGLRQSGFGGSWRSSHRRRAAPSRVFVGDQRFGDVSHARVPGAEAFYDEDLTGAVQALYSKDLRRYGYSGPGSLGNAPPSSPIGKRRSEGVTVPSGQVERQASVRTPGVPSIPRRIFQYWHQESVPDDVASLMETWREMAGYEYLLFDDVRAGDFIAQHYPREYLSAYQDLRMPASRSDFFRLAYLAVTGGVYVDAGIVARQPLDDWLGPDDSTVMVRKWNNVIMNGFMASYPGNALFARMIEMAMRNVRAKSSDNVWLLTGAGVLRKVLADSVEPVRVIEWRPFLEHCRPVLKLEHKKGHWSERQKVETLFHSDTKDSAGSD